MKFNLIAAQQNAGSQMLSMLVLFVVLFGVMYFFSIRPQKKKIAEQQERLSKVKKGDKVITRSGLHGSVYSVDSQAHTFVLDADGIYLTFEMGAIMELTPNDKDSDDHINTKDDTDAQSKDDSSDDSEDQE